MTARDELRAVAAAETARVYGRLCREASAPSPEYVALLARAEELEANEGIDQALRAGRPVSEIVALYGVDYATVRAARKRLMRGAA